MNPECLPLLLTSLINNRSYRSTNVRFHLSYEIKITLQSHFLVRKRFGLPYIRDVVVHVIS